MMHCATVYCVLYRLALFATGAHVMWEVFKKPKMSLPKDKTTPKRPKRPLPADKSKRDTVLAPTRSQEAKKLAAKKAAAAKKAPYKKR
jgi:hypothetical protein